MKITFFLVFLLFSFSLFASQVQIVEIIEGEDFLVLADNGEVYEFNEASIEQKDKLYQALENKDFISFKFKSTIKNIFEDSNIRKTIKKIETIKKNKTFQKDLLSKELRKNNIPTAIDNYTPTQLESIEDITQYFKTMTRRTRRRSQCYNRAHVWAYELFKSKNLQLGKTWIFFSRKYIEEYKYKWWFHIAPDTRLKGSNEIIVLDRTFSRDPLSVRDWTNKFMQNDAECKVVEYYSHYRNNQQSEWCFLIHSSMYYWQPHQIKKLELDGPEKKEFKMSELKRAYKNAIKRWDGEVP